MMRRDNIMQIKDKIYKNVKIFLVIILILVLFISSIKFVAKKFIFPLKYKEQVFKYSDEYNVDPYLIYAVIKAESKFNPNAISNKDAKGLMQLLETTASEISIYEILDLFDVDINISLGTKYLSSLVSRYNGNYYLAICAYNAGMGNLDKWLDNGIINKNLSNHLDNNIPINETKDYLKKVINNYNSYKVLYDN